MNHDGTKLPGFATMERVRSPVQANVFHFFLIFDAFHSNIYNK